MELDESMLINILVNCGKSRDLALMGRQSQIDDFNSWTAVVFGDRMNG